VLLALIYGIFAFTIWKLYRNKKPMLKYLAPIVLNTFVSFIGSFFILFAITCLLVDFIHWWKHFPLLFGGTLLMVIPNILFYRLYYKRKNKLSRKEYILASIYGLMIFVLYIIQINLLGASF
jgi:hypothetical protein